MPSVGAAVGNELPPTCWLEAVRSRPPAEQFVGFSHKAAHATCQPSSALSYSPRGTPAPHTGGGASKGGLRSTVCDLWDRGKSETSREDAE